MMDAWARCILVGAEVRCHEGKFEGVSAQEDKVVGREVRSMQVVEYLCMFSCA